MISKSSINWNMNPKLIKMHQDSNNSPIDTLLAAAKEYFAAKAEHDKAEHDAGKENHGLLTTIKKRFALALNNYIDFRVAGALEDQKKKRISTESSVIIADVLNEETKDSIAALNSAPSPLKPEALKNKTKREQWMEAYQVWYNGARKKGLS